MGAADQVGRCRAWGRHPVRTLGATAGGAPRAANGDERGGMGGGDVAQCWDADGRRGGRATAGGRGEGTVLRMVAREFSRECGTCAT